MKHSTIIITCRRTGRRFSLERNTECLKFKEQRKQIQLEIYALTQ